MQVDATLSSTDTFEDYAALGPNPVKSADNPPDAPVLPPSRRRWGWKRRLLVTLLALPFALIALLYAVLLITPIPLTLTRGPAQAAVRSALPPGSSLELGNMALALEGGFWPVLQFSPVVLHDSKSGSKIRMEALEIGFSPLRAVVGQPGASITMVGPHIQMVQDLLGPRPATLEIVDDPNGGMGTVRVLEGENAFPSVGISSEGINVRGIVPPGGSAELRSDNDWLIYNMESAEQGLAGIVEQAEQGRFSRLVIRDGVIDMNDAVYGFFRSFSGITLDIVPSPDGRVTSGTFSATLAGRTMSGTVARTVGDEGHASLSADVTNVDFASFMPFIDDPDSMVAIKGAGAVSILVDFDGVTGKTTGGHFKIDMTGTDLRIEDDMFPIASSIIEVEWTPADGKFTMAESELRVGKSSGTFSGTFAMGLDNTYGPTIAMAMVGKNVVIHPNDMDAPAEPFTEMSFNGWSAPLYGAMGIDRTVLSRPGTRIETAGRIDMLRAGMGLNLDVAGEGVSADDLKRIWPYMMSGETRDWVVKSITGGTVTSAALQFNFPVGTFGKPGEEKPLPPNSLSIDMTATGVGVKPTDTMDPVEVTGNTVLKIRDTNITFSADGGQMNTANGPIQVTRAAMVIENDAPDHRVIEISGDINGGVPALVAMAKQQQPQAIANAALPVNLESLDGLLALSLVTTIQTGAAGTQPDIDYVVDGSVQNFGSSEPIQDRRIGNGQLKFRATQDGYDVAGTTEIDGIAADVSINGTPDGQPNLALRSTVKVADLKAMGFDASEFLSGEVGFEAKPIPDGRMQIHLDLAKAGLKVKDLGLSKAEGVAGSLDATAKLGEVAEVTDIKLAFGDVRLEGGLVFDTKGNTLKSADFSNIALSKGDQAALSLTPIQGGYSAKVRGEQLDFKPMLQRFFNLGSGSGGVETENLKQTIALDVELKRVLGSYGTTAFNVDLDLAMRNGDLTRVNFQANLGGSRAISVTTNPAPEGRVMTVAFNDAGTLLRLLGVYSQIEGGEGSLVLNQNTKEKYDVGRLQLRRFAIIDEDKVAEILGNHQGSKSLIARRNKLEFKSAQVDFVRRSDRVQVTEGLLAGDTVGGTMRGFIYTDKRQYDLTGTYVPLFGLSNAFQKIPVFGQLLGGRRGEGLFGVTFAVRGGLEKPDFRINPASALVPGAFRQLFEYRARELPRED